jgi:hypothetical protein
MNIQYDWVKKDHPLYKSHTGQEDILGKPDLLFLDELTDICREFFSSWKAAGRRADKE